MFSKKYKINWYEVKSALKTAAFATIGTFGLSTISVYNHIMVLDWKFFIAPIVFGLVTFIWDGGRKFFRDGGKKNVELASKLLDQNLPKE